MNAWKYLVVLLCLASCKSRQTGSIVVNGSVKNFDKLEALYPGTVRNGAITVLLYEIPFGGDGQPIQLDSAVLTEKNNSFSLKGAAATIGMYDILIDRGGPMIPFVNDEPELTINIDFSKKDNYYSITGSKASKQLQDFIHDYSQRSIAFNKALTQIDSLKSLNASDSLLLIATNAKNKAMDDLNAFLNKFLSSIDQPIVASFALGRSAQTLPTADFEKHMNNLVEKFPQEMSIQALKNQYNVYKAQAAELERQRNSGSWIGKKAPELVMPDPNGNNISLSSFKGKYVLVDFWASWCRPCRLENPNVVAAYNQFKNKNFTIVGVSLDKTKEDWVEAIKADGLSWTHMSDLAFWGSKAVTTFGFEGIPYNVLIDPQGTVIAEGLRGEGLTSKLSEVLK